MSETIPIRSYFGDRVLSAGFMAVPHLLRQRYISTWEREEDPCFSPRVAVAF
jgi:hypothetical protein